MDPYSYTDPQNHRVQVLTTRGKSGQSYIWLEGENLAPGGMVANVWLPLPEARELADLLDVGKPAGHVDHMGDTLAVEPGEAWTRFTFTHVEDDGQPRTVPVVVLTARLPEVVTAIRAAADRAAKEQPAAAECPPGVHSLFDPCPGNCGAPVEEPFVPRTEREYWQAIADALNAANRVGMPVGIDLDGTLTDHNAHSVIWNFEAERWDVAGYEDNDQGPAVEEQPADATETPDATVRRFARRLHAVEQLCSGRPGYHTITVKALLTAMSEADEEQQAEPGPAAVPARVRCAHDYWLMQDSCPGCDAEQERPHAPEMVTVHPEWSNRPIEQCRRCSLRNGAAIHKPSKRATS